MHETFKKPFLSLSHARKKKSLINIPKQGIDEWLTRDSSLRCVCIYNMYMLYVCRKMRLEKSFAPFRCLVSEGRKCVELCFTALALTQETSWKRRESFFLSPSLPACEMGSFNVFDTHIYTRYAHVRSCKV